MTYNEIIQTMGRRIVKHVYYINNGSSHYISDDSIDSIKFTTKTGLIGTLMNGCEIILKEPINGDIYVSIEAKYGEYIASELYGPYFLKEEPKYDADKKLYTHTCYDGIIKSMIPYEALNINYPCSVYSFFSELITELGYSTNVLSLPNGTRQMSSDLYYGINYTYRDVLDDIAQANGVLFYIDGNVIKIANLNDNGITIDDDILKNQNISFGEHFGPINSVVLSRGAGADNVYLKDDESIAQYGLHEYKITDNQLMNNDDRSDYLQALANQLFGIEYDIYDVELTGYGDILPLQKITFETGDSEYNSYLFNNEIELKDGYKQSIYVELPDETNTDYTTASKTDKAINQTNLVVDKINQIVQSLVSKVVDISIDGETRSNNLQFEGIALSSPFYIRLYPINENIMLLYPNDNVKPSSNLKTKVRILRFTNTETNEIVDYEIPTDLYYYNSNTYDELIIDWGNKECKVIKRCELNQTTGLIEALDSEEILHFDYPDIVLTKGNYTISVVNANSVYIYAKMMLENDYTSQMTPEVELKSVIEQTANQIMLAVNEKVNEDEIIAKINLAVEDDRGIIELKGNSVIIDSDNFKLDASGKIKATSGEFSGRLKFGSGDSMITAKSVTYASQGITGVLFSGEGDFSISTYSVGINAGDGNLQLLSNNGNVNIVSPNGEITASCQKLLLNSIGQMDIKSTAWIGVNGSGYSNWELKRIQCADGTYARVLAHPV